MDMTPHSEGTVPVRRLSSRASKETLDNRPTSVGIGPVRLLFAIDRWAGERQKDEQLLEQKDNVFNAALQTCYALSLPRVPRMDGIDFLNLLPLRSICLRLVMLAMVGGMSPPTIVFAMWSSSMLVKAP